MALTLEEVERMEQQAALSRRFNAASDDYVARNNPGLRAKEREQVLRAAEGDVFAQARQRRLDANREIARNDPGRYSSFERNALLGIDKNGRALIDRSERDILRQHELQMLRQQGLNAIGAEEAKARGLAMNGMEAARIKGAADVQAAQIGADAAQYQAEIEWSKKQQIAGMQFGMIGPDGKLIPGSNERTAGVQGEWDVKKQQEANKGLFARAEIDRQKQERDIEGKLQNTVLKNGAKLQGDKVKAYSGIISRAISSGSFIGEDTATSLAKLAQANQNNPELLEAITAISGNGQQPNNAPAQPPAMKIPGYSQAKIEELQKRGYTWQNGKWVKTK